MCTTDISCFIEPVANQRDVETGRKLQLVALAWEIGVCPDLLFFETVAKLGNGLYQFRSGAELPADVLYMRVHAPCGGFHG